MTAESRRFGKRYHVSLFLSVLQEFDHTSAGPPRGENSTMAGAQWFQQFLGCLHPRQEEPSAGTYCKDPGAVTNADRSGMSVAPVFMNCVDV